MNTVSVETHRLYPGGIESQAVVERDHTGRLVRVVAVDYQLDGGRTLADVAATYAILHGAELGRAA